MNKFILSAALLLTICAAHAQELTKRHIPVELKNSTLLVEQFKKKDADDIYFKSLHIDKSKIKHFIQQHNHRLFEKNTQYKKTFKDNYAYSNKLVSHSEVDSHDSTEYRFVFVHELINLSPMKQNSTKEIKNDFFSFNHYILDRKTGKRYADIKIYHKNYWKNLKIIVKSMNDFLDNQ
jgi:hypothetical protein